MSRITTQEGETLMECDHCERIERFDNVHRDWIEISAFEVGPHGGGPITNTDDENVGVVACSKACLRRAFNVYVDQWLSHLKPR